MDTVTVDRWAQMQDIFARLNTALGTVGTTFMVMPKPGRDDYGYRYRDPALVYQATVCSTWYAFDVEFALEFIKGDGGVVGMVSKSVTLTPRHTVHPGQGVLSQCRYAEEFLRVSTALVAFQENDLGPLIECCTQDTLDRLLEKR